jgi:hypothetical protein
MTSLPRCPLNRGRFTEQALTPAAVPTTPARRDLLAEFLEWLKSHPLGAALVAIVLALTLYGDAGSGYDRLVGS